jgi:hypothetical protein
MGLRFRMAPEIGWKVGIVPAGLRETTARPTNKLGQVGPFGMLNGPQAKQQEYAQRISGLYYSKLGMLLLGQGPRFIPERLLLEHDSAADMQSNAPETRFSILDC